MSLEVPPELWVENERWLNAFNDLIESRNAAFSVGRILYGEILAYAQLMEIDDMVTLTRRIRACDAAWIALQKGQNGTA